MGLGAAATTAMLKAIGTDVTFGAATTKGLLDVNVPDDGALPAEGGSMAVAETVTVLTIQRGTLPGLAHGSQITVGADSYYVRSIRPIEDGEIMQVLVRRGTP